MTPVAQAIRPGRNKTPVAPRCLMRLCFSKKCLELVGIRLYCGYISVLLVLRFLPLFFLYNFYVPILGGPSVLSTRKILTETRKDFQTIPQFKSHRVSVTCHSTLEQGSPLDDTQRQVRRSSLNRASFH